jgi:hypothetical protein
MDLQLFNMKEMNGIKWLATFEDGSIMDSLTAGSQFIGDTSSIRKFKEKSKELKCTSIRVQMDGKTITFSNSEKSLFPCSKDVKFDMKINLTLEQGYTTEIINTLIIMCISEKKTINYYINIKTHDSWVQVV